MGEEWWVGRHAGDAVAGSSLRRVQLAAMGEEELAMVHRVAVEALAAFRVGDYLSVRMAVFTAASLEERVGLVFKAEVVLARMVQDATGVHA